MSNEAPFRPREELIEKQRLYQSIHKHTHLKGPMDKLTSVAIPLALAGSCLFLIVSSSYPSVKQFLASCFTYNKRFLFFIFRDVGSITCLMESERKIEKKAHKTVTVYYFRIPFRI